MQKTVKKNYSQEPQTLINTATPSLLEAHKARKLVENINGWQLTSDHKMIYREFLLPNFMDAVDMIDRIALIAEDEKHHPDIHLTQCHILRVGLTTHAVGGLSEKDLIVARKINELPITKDRSKKAELKAIPIHKLRYKQNNGVAKKVKPISLVLKKSTPKTTGIKTKKSLNRISQKIKKAK